MHFVVPIYHCFIDSVDDVSRLPDWQTDIDGSSTASTGGANTGQTPRGASSTLFLVMPLTGANLHHHATKVIHSRLAPAAARKQLSMDGASQGLTAAETGGIQALPVLSTIGWVGVGAQLAAGLAHMAEAGVAHRDVKMDNILVTEGNADVPTVELTDFGAALDARAVAAAAAEPGTFSSGSDRQAPAGAQPPRSNVFRVPAGPSLVRVAGGAVRRGGSPYNLPPEVLLPPIDAATATLDYGGADSWALGTVLHELVAPTVEPWPGLREMHSPFSYKYEGATYQFLRASYKPQPPPLLAAKGRSKKSKKKKHSAEVVPASGTALGLGVLAAGLVDKLLLLPTVRPNDGPGSETAAVRLPMREAREGFGALLLLLWWEEYMGGFDEGSSAEPRMGLTDQKPQLGPPLEVVQEVVAVVKVELGKRMSKTLLGATRWVLEDYLARESAVIIHQRLSWLYEVYGTGLSVGWPHSAEGGVWPPGQFSREES